MARRFDARQPNAMTLRILAASLLSLTTASQAQGNPDPISWHDARTLTIEGQGWTETKAPYDRLPAAAEGVVRTPVWRLSRHSSGIAVRFLTDAPALHVRWTLTSDRLAMPHMPATGASGLDLYCRDGDGRWRWMAVAIPSTGDQQPERTHLARLFDGRSRQQREYMLYLPLYNGVESVSLGAPEDCEVRAAPTRSARPIVFYGTSITQGGCASRPGMTHSAILGRRLERPVINLGFSGNGRMEPEVAGLLAELDAAIFVIDCLPNMTGEQVKNRVESLVRIVRDARGNTPILLVEDRTYQDSWWSERRRSRNTQSRDELRRSYDQMVAGQVLHLHYVHGDELLGDDGEATGDGSHPTDLGFFRQAAILERAIAPLIGGEPR